jgi:hypothetical protein
MVHGVKCGGRVAVDISAKANVAAELPSEVSQLLKRFGLAPPPKGRAIPMTANSRTILTP